LAAFSGALVGRDGQICLPGGIPITLDSILTECLAKRHDLSRNLIRIWVQKYEAGGLDEDAAAADMIQEYEARIAALERLVGKQALELEFLKGALRNAPRPRSAATFVITGPQASPSPKDVG
jgi:transposase